MKIFRQFEWRNYITGHPVTHPPPCIQAKNLGSNKLITQFVTIVRETDCYHTLLDQGIQVNKTWHGDFGNVHNTDT